MIFHRNNREYVNSYEQLPSEIAQDILGDIQEKLQQSNYTSRGNYSVYMEWMRYTSSKQHLYLNKSMKNNDFIYNIAFNTTPRVWPFEDKDQASWSQSFWCTEITIKDRNNILTIELNKLLEVVKPEANKDICFWRISTDLTNINKKDSELKAVLHVVFPHRVVGEAFKAQGMQAQYSNNREFQIFLEYFKNYMKSLNLIKPIDCEHYTLHPHQQVFELLFHPKVDKNFRCSIETPTGSGKSMMIISAIENFRNDKRPVVLLFSTDTHKRSFEMELTNHLTSQDKGSWLTVHRCTIQSHSTFFTQASKKSSVEELLKDGAIFIMDESHLLWSKSSTNAPGNRNMESLRDQLMDYRSDAFFRGCAVLMVSATPDNETQYIFRTHRGEQMMHPSTWRLTYGGLTSVMYPENVLWPRSALTTSHIVDGEMRGRYEEIISKPLDPLKYIDFRHMRGVEDIGSNHESNRINLNLIKYVLDADRKQTKQTKQASGKQYVRVGLFAPKTAAEKFNANTIENELGKVRSELWLKDFFIIRASTNMNIQAEIQATREKDLLLIIDGKTFTEAVDLSGLDLLVITSPIKTYAEYKQVIGRIFRGCKQLTKRVSVLTLVNTKIQLKDIDSLKSNAVSTLIEEDSSKGEISLMQDLIDSKMQKRMTEEEFLTIKTSFEQKKGNVNITEITEIMTDQIVDAPVPMDEVNDADEIAAQLLIEEMNRLEQEATERFTKFFEGGVRNQLHMNTLDKGTDEYKKAFNVAEKYRIIAEKYVKNINVDDFYNIVNLVLNDSAIPKNETSKMTIFKDLENA